MMKQKQQKIIITVTEDPDDSDSCILNCKFDPVIKNEDLNNLNYIQEVALKIIWILSENGDLISVNGKRVNT